MKNRKQLDYFDHKMSTLSACAIIMFLSSSISIPPC